MSRTDGMTTLELSNITLRRNGNLILSNVSWRIERGQHWALLGANGSGKTTLLKVITGYEWPTSGQVTVLGKRFGQCDIRELRKTIGWVSSSLEHKLPGSDTAAQIVLSGKEASLGVYRPFSAEEEETARQLLRALGADNLAERPYGLLSQGEQQRVLIARALIANPALLILDEPCAGLDPMARARFLADLGALAHRPNAPALILVTHHVEEIGPWINRVLVLKSGTTLAMGTPHEVVTGPTLGQAFNADCHVSYEHGHHWLRIRSRLGEP